MNMKKLVFGLLILPLLIFYACDKNDDDINSSNAIIGYWVNPIWTDSVVTYDRTMQLSENEYGLAFYANGELVERKNAGGCGTPPISYADFDGDWIEKDSILDVSVEFWGGIENVKWSIKLINDTNLTLHRLSIEYHHENEN